MLPHAAHAREVVLELRELDLELSLGRRRVLGEDVEDQLRPVDDARVERVLEEPLLRRDRARRRRAGTPRRRRRSAASAPRACPCRRRCAAPAARDAGRRLRPARRPPSGRARGPRPAPPPASTPWPSTARTKPRSGSGVRGIIGSKYGTGRPHPRPREHPVRIAQRGGALRLRPAARAARAGLRRRRVHPLRQARGQAARAARGPHRHGSRAGQPARAGSRTAQSSASARAT